ncbi:MAG TPA: hypothetical protein VHQ41_01720 [Patescibacteria group bacterium]|nr:hypothetical protein [Patescibacteria group bacterium]
MSSYLLLFDHYTNKDGGDNETMPGLYGEDEKDDTLADELENDIRRHHEKGGSEEHSSHAAKNKGKFKRVNGRLVEQQ